MVEFKITPKSVKTLVNFCRSNHPSRPMKFAFLRFSSLPLEDDL